MSEVGGATTASATVAAQLCCLQVEHRPSIIPSFYAFIDSTVAILFSMVFQIKCFNFLMYQNKCLKFHSLWFLFRKVVVLIFRGLWLRFLYDLWSQRLCILSSPLTDHSLQLNSQKIN